jgi:adenosylmethionine-8-amino-7-oxononanoate aminotransferase
VHTPRAGYLEGLRRLCDDHGALLVFDEVITGFGRLGTWFAAEHYGVEPDLVTFAKAVTSGYIPLGGVIVGSVVRRALEKDPEMILRTGFTYSGHPTATAAGVACLAVTDEQGLLLRARALGELFSDRLGGLLSDGLVTEVRGEGAIWAVDIAEDGPADAPTIAQAMIDDGVIVRPIGPATLALCPPLVLTDDEAGRIVESMRSALAG